MGRRRYREDIEGQERWLVSYADLVTLLLAFFVVMYAISSVNQGKYRLFSQALGSAFSADPPAGAALPATEAPNFEPLLAPRTPPPHRQRARQAALQREREQMTGMAQEILRALSPLVSQGKVRVTQSDLGVSVEINASVLFAPGEASLSAQSAAALEAAAQVLRQHPQAIRVEGHTDNQPIRNARYLSNWELSAARASRVVRLLSEHGVAEARLSAVGHGSNQALAPNETAQGRLRNRRVELLILSSSTGPATEVPIGPGVLPPAAPGAGARP